jgi:hypothetical protein
MMMRALFLREEGDVLVLAPGLSPGRIRAAGAPRFGPAPTSFGLVQVTAAADGDADRVEWRAEWRRAPARLLVALPGRRPVAVPSPAADGAVRVPPEPRDA